MNTLLVHTVTDWYCPNCGMTDQTRTETRPHVRMHPCASMDGFLAPMVLKGVKAKVEMRLWDDYEGKEHTQHNAAGRPVMSIVTTRDNGTDAVVFAPTATGRARDLKE